MRETRSSGSVEGVMSNRDPYSDYRRHGVKHAENAVRLVFSLLPLQVGTRPAHNSEVRPQLQVETLVRAQSVPAISQSELQ